MPMRHSLHLSINHQQSIDHPSTHFDCLRPFSIIPFWLEETAEEIRKPFGVKTKTGPFGKLQAGFNSCGLLRIEHGEIGDSTIEA